MALTVFPNLARAKSTHRSTGIKNRRASMARHATSLETERPVRASGPVPGLGRHAALGGSDAEHDGSKTLKARVLQSKQGEPSYTAVVAVGKQPAAGKRLSRTALLVVASLITLAGAAYFGWQYWTFGRFEVLTDDAYVQADNTTIAPKGLGFGTVLAGDNEGVQAGQVPAHIDDRDFRVAVDQAKADVTAAQAAIASKHASLDAHQSIIEAARATIGIDQASQTFTEQDDKRYAALAATGYGSVQNAQQAASRIAAARASVARDTVNVVGIISKEHIADSDAESHATVKQLDDTLQHALNSICRGC
jgi:membrane fusion protein, multidrug efflux system